MTIRASVIAIAGVLAAAACGGVSGLEDLKTSKKPYFYVGTSFDGLDLTHIDTTAEHVASFIYGDCHAGSDMGCAPPLEVRSQICSDGAVIVVLFGDGDHAAKAQQALRPVNEAARRLGKPREVVFDYSPRC